MRFGRAPHMKKLVDGFYALFTLVTVPGRDMLDVTEDAGTWIGVLKAFDSIGMPKVMQAVAEEANEIIRIIGKAAEKEVLENRVPKAVFLGPWELKIVEWFFEMYRMKTTGPTRNELPTGVAIQLYVAAGLLNIYPASMSPEVLGFHWMGSTIQVVNEQWIEKYKWEP